MSLVAIAVHDTEHNNRTWMTEKTIQSYAETVDWTKHRLFLVDNNSCIATQKLYERARDWLPFTLISNDVNLGTARAINKAWIHRKNGESALKGDNDCVIHQKGWLDILEECITRDDGVKLNGQVYRAGILGLKRRDLDEWVLKPKGVWDHSFFHPFPHDKTKGQRWIAVEVVNHVMGTCCLFSSALLDKIGYLYQSGLYGL